jgi:hypothetical protein
LVFGLGVPYDAIDAGANKQEGKLKKQIHKSRVNDEFSMVLEWEGD